MNNPLPNLPHLAISVSLLFSPSMLWATESSVSPRATSISPSVVATDAKGAHPITAAQTAEIKLASITSGGGTTVRKSGPNAFSLPAANLPLSKRLDFSVGNSFFRNPWVEAPASTDARDGLGPLFNTNGCQNCHIKDGRGIRLKRGIAMRCRRWCG